MGIGVGVSLLLAFLFFDNLWFALLMIPLTVLIYQSLGKRARKKREQQALNEFKEWILSLSSALMTGKSVESAIENSLVEMRYLFGSNSEIYEQVEQMVCKLKLRVSLQEIIGEYGRNSSLEEVKEFSEMFLMAKKSGGNLKELIETTANNIRGGIEVMREIDVVINGKKYEQKVMMAIPVGMIFYIRLTSPEMISVMYANLAGQLIMGLCLGVYLFSAWWASRIVRIEV